MAVASSNPIHYFLKFVGLLACVLFAVQSVFLLTQIQADSVGRDSLFFLMIIQLTPFVLSLTTLRFSYLGFILLNHFFTYSVAKYNSVFNVLGLSAVPYDSRLAIRELINSTLLIVIGYYAVKSFAWYRISQQQRSETITLRLANKQLLMIGLIVFTSSWLSPLLPAAVKQLHDLAYVMCLILMISSDASQSKKLHQLLILGALINMSNTLVEHGSLIDFGHFAVILFVRSCLRKDFKGLGIVISIVLIGLFIQPIKGTYRTQSRLDDFSYSEKMGILVNLISWRYFTRDGWDSQVVGDEESAEDDLGSLDREGGAFSALSLGFTRVHDDSFERTLMMTPSRVPFWEGETYTNLLFMFVPRLLWPDKPGWKHWHKFGKSYGYLAPNDDQTSISFSMFAEAYMNFGFSGLYIISLIFGVIIAVTERTAFSLFGGPYIFVFVSMLTPIMNYSADLGMMVNRLVIVSTGLLIFRPFLIRNVIGDDYSR